MAAASYHYSRPGKGSQIPLLVTGFDIWGDMAYNSFSGKALPAVKKQRTFYGGLDDDL